MRSASTPRRPAAPRRHLSAPRRRLGPSLSKGPAPAALTALTALALVGAVVPCGVAAAQEGRPTIATLADGSGLPNPKNIPGGTVVLRGENLHTCPPGPEDPAAAGALPRCDHAELRVTIDGTPMMLFGVGPGEVIARIPPEARPGRRTIRVVVGRRGEATAQVELVPVEQWDREREQRIEEGEDGSSPALEKSVYDNLKFTEFELVPGPTGNTFRFDGIARKLPDGCSVQVTLRYANRPIATQTVPVQAGAFQGAFGPYTKRLLLGSYEVHLVFEVRSQPRALIQPWQASLSPAERDLYRRVLRTDRTQVGGRPGHAPSADELAQQQAQLRTHYVQLTDEARALLDELQDAFGGAARSLFRQAGQSAHDDERYRAYLADLGIAADGEHLDRIAADQRYATAGGHFKPREFEQWVAGEYLPRLEALDARQRAFADQYLAPMDEGAERLGDFLISILLRQKQRWAEALYAKSELAVPPALADVPLTIQTPSPTVSLRFFEAKRRELLRRIGIEPGD